MQGSGKTLAFGLPILQALLAEKDAMGRAGSLGLRKDAAIEVTTDHMESTVETDKGCVPTTELGEQRLRALILVPTRELAIQVLPCTASLWFFTYAVQTKECGTRT